MSYPCVAEGRPSLTIRRGSVPGRRWNSSPQRDCSRRRARSRAPPMMMSFSLSTARPWHQLIGKSVRRRKTIIVFGTNRTERRTSAKRHLARCRCMNASSPSRTRRDFAGSRIRTRSISTTTRTGKMGHPRQANWSKLPFACALAGCSAGDPRWRRRDRLPRRLADRTSGGHNDDPRQRLQCGFDRLRVLIKQTPGGAAVSDADIASQLAP